MRFSFEKIQLCFVFTQALLLFETKIPVTLTIMKVLKSHDEIDEFYLTVICKA